MRILLVRVSALGDAIHTLPALDLLKKQLPPAHIDWLVQQKNFGIVSHIPGINRVYTLHDHYLRPAQLRKTFALLNTLRNNRYDLVIDFQGLCKTSFLCAALDLPSIGFDWRTAREWLSSVVHHHTVAVPKTTNIIEKNKALALAAVEVVRRMDPESQSGMTGDKESSTSENKIYQKIVIPASEPGPSPFLLSPPTYNFHSNKKNTTTELGPRPSTRYCSLRTKAVPLIPSDCVSNRIEGRGDDDVENKTFFNSSPLILRSDEVASRRTPLSGNSAPQPSTAAQQNVTTWLNKHHARRLVILTPNTTWDSKHWPLSRWEELASKIAPLIPIQASLLEATPDLSNQTRHSLWRRRGDCASNRIEGPRHTVVCVGQKFGKQGARLAAFIEQHNLPIVIAPPWSLDELFAIMRATDLIVAPDTGLLHIADSIGVATIGLYGPTLVARHGPQITPGNKELCFQVSCSHEYQKTHGPIDCMNQLSAEAVIERIRSIISYISTTKPIEYVPITTMKP